VIAPFQVVLRKFCNNASAGMKQARKDIALDLYGSIVDDNPVKTGLSAGNWQASYGIPKTRVLPIRSKEAVKAEIVAVLDALPGDNMLFFRNNVFYTRFLEEGWSQQAPAGMVRKNLARLSRIVAAATRKARST
jgi:hypothetical protein